MANKKEDFVFDYEFVKEFYAKKNECKALESELKKMSMFIKKSMIKNGKRAMIMDKYSLYIEACHKPTEDLIGIIKESEYKDVVKEMCSIKDAEEVCRKLDLDIKDYREFWFDKLYVNKK